MTVRWHYGSKHMHIMLGILVTILIMCSISRGVEIFRSDSDRNCGSTKWEWPAVYTDETEPNRTFRIEKDGTMNVMTWRRKYQGQRNTFESAQVLNPGLDKAPLIMVWLDESGILRGKDEANKEYALSTHIDYKSKGPYRMTYSYGRCYIHDKDQTEIWTFPKREKRYRLLSNSPEEDLDGNSELTSDDGKYSFIISGVGPRRILGPNSMRVLSTKPVAALGLCGGGSLRFHTYDSNGKVIGDNKHYPPLGGVHPYTLRLGNDGNLRVFDNDGICVNPATSYVRSYDKVCYYRSGNGVIRSACWMNDWRARDAFATEHGTFDKGRFSYELDGGRYYCAFMPNNGIRTATKSWGTNWKERDKFARHHGTFEYGRFSYKGSDDNRVYCAYTGE
jgi:hypothetical protein